MNNKKNIILLLFFFVSGCWSLDESEALINEVPKYVISIKDINQTSGWNASGALNDMRFLKLQSIERLLITGTYKLEISGQRVHIFDRRINTIFVFDLNGKFLHKIEGSNNGYNERFEYLMDFAVSKVSKDVVTIDYNARKLYLFDSLGKMKKEVKTDYFISNIFEISDDLWVIKNRNTDSPDTPYVLYFLDKDLNLLEKAFLRETISANSDISDVSPFFNYQGETRFSYGLGNKIFNVSKSGVTINSIADFGPNAIDNDILQKTPLRQLMTEFRSSKNAGIIGDYLETEDQVFFSFLQGGEEMYRGRKAMFYSKTHQVVKVVTKKIKHDSGFNIPWPQTVYQGNYVSVFNFYNFFEDNSQIFNDKSRRDSTNKSFGWFNSFQELLPLVNEPDSPILMFYKLDFTK